jgi:hypothetical protein
MTRDAVRAILGVWMPMAIGGWIILVALLFFVGPAEDVSLEARIATTLFFVAIGGMLVLSTLGRYRKAKAARDEG